MKWVKGALVVFFAVIITALGIDAADSLQGNDGTLLSQLAGNSNGCPQGMVLVSNVPGVRCADAYEVSTSNNCPVQKPTQILHTLQNLEEANCLSKSVSNAHPWNFVTRDQAVQICARSGKRLPTSAEWFALSAGIAQPEENCNTSSNKISLTGSYPECTSQSDIYDMVGNLWEWVSDDVINGMYNMRDLPKSGYIAQVDSSGMATVSTSTPSELFESDYFWSNKNGAFGIIRGGYYGTGSDGGMYAVHADTLPTTAGIGVGFRCVI